MIEFTMCEVHHEEELAIGDYFLIVDGHVFIVVDDCYTFTYMLSFGGGFVVMMFLFEMKDMGLCVVFGLFAEGCGEFEGVFVDGVEVVLELVQLFLFEELVLGFSLGVLGDEDVVGEVFVCLLFEFT